VIDKGAIPLIWDREAAREVMGAEVVPVSVELGNGTGSRSGCARMLGSDLSYDYVRINAEYTT
jgi:N-acetylglutamate synthase/N-acetylornithine aminotransferase